jgi:hypothetical protein
VVLEQWVIYGGVAADVRVLKAVAGEPARGRPVTALLMPSCSSQLTSWSYVCTQLAVFRFDGVLGEEPEVEVALV